MNPTKSQLAVAILGGVVVATVAIVVVTALASRKGQLGAEGSGHTSDHKPDAGSPAAGGLNSETDRVRTQPGDRPSPSDAALAGDQSANRYEIVADDGDLLWASPTDGTPVDLSFVPPAAQLLVIARPADILAQAEGDKVLKAMGPRFAELRASCEADWGVKLDEVGQLIVAMIPQNDRMPRVATVVRLRETRDLVALWDNPSPKLCETHTYYEIKDRCFYIPEQAEGRVYVTGTLEDIRQVIQSGGAAPVMRRELARLRQATDADRHFTVLVAPNFLFADGRKLFSGSLAKVLAPLDWFLEDGIQAGMLSLHLGHDFYAEARLLSVVETLPTQLASRLRARIDELPTKLERYLGQIELDYWQPLAIKFPGMIRFVAGKTRIGVESDEAVMNFVLPLSAAHNLVLASELALASPPAAPSSPPQSVPAPVTIHDVLAQRISLDIPQQSLEFALRDLCEQVNESIPNLSFRFDVKILGTDLREEGITRNQQIRDFKRADGTVAELLTDLVQRANPVTTVTDPSEDEQKLVWVVGPDPDDPGRQQILITTRRGAQQKGYQLPGPFQGETRLSQ